MKSRSRAELSRTITPMKTPKRLQPLIDEGLIDRVVRQLMSGKEATVFVVRCGDETRCAKVYKEADAAQLPPGGRLHREPQGQEQPPGARHGQGHALRPPGEEAAWQSAEVDALYRLAAAGVRVPKPYNFHDGVLLMELVDRRARRRRAAPERRRLHAEEARRTTRRC